LPALERLDLHGTLIGDGALPRLKLMRKLRHLNVSHTKVSRDGVVELCAALPICEVSWALSYSW
jgi:hypothetical protein